MINSSLADADARVVMTNSRERFSACAGALSRHDKSAAYCLERELCESNDAELKL